MIRVQNLETKEEHDCYKLTPKNLDEIAEWCGGRVDIDVISNRTVVIVPTRIYPIRAYPGDYILKRERPRGGEFFLKDATMFGLFFEEL